jgi:4-amino-4-deoxy-L-arabinose transferase-like glycosyltransferase
MASPGATPLPRSPAARVRLEWIEAWGPQLVVVLALAFLGWCTLTAIERPGMEYDEALFVNAALGGHYPNFVTSRVLGVPTMVMPYSGALKSWLYAPIFRLVGVSVTSIRLPAIAMLVVTILIAFACARRLLGRWPAALLALLMATDPAFMTMAKADWGPVALSALLRIAALAAYVTWARTASARWLWVAAAAVVLGIFNKLDYLAFAAALGLAAVVVDHCGIRARVRAAPLAAGLALGALACVLLLEYVEIVAPARAFPVARSHADLFGRVSELWYLARTTMDGSEIFPYMTTRPFDQTTAITTVAVTAVVVAAGLGAWRLSRMWRPLRVGWERFAESARISSFVLILLLAMFAALVLTPQAIGPHHAMLLWPLPALLAVSLLSAATRLPGPRLRVGVVVLLASGLVWLAGTQVRVAESYRVGFARDGAWQSGWTPEIYAVTDAVRRAAGGVDHVVTADWGFGNQLFALGGDGVRRRLDDAWGTFAFGPPASIDQLAASTLRGQRSVLVLHPPGAEQMPGTYRAAQAMLRRLAPARGVHVLYSGAATLAYVVDDRR